MREGQRLWRQRRLQREQVAALQLPGRFPSEVAAGVGARGDVRRVRERSFSDGMLERRKRQVRGGSEGKATGHDEAYLNKNATIVDECREACIRNCSCTAFTSSDWSGCITWFGDLVDLRPYIDGRQDLWVRVAL